MAKLPKRIAVNVFIEYCEECPHHEDYVGDKFCKKIQNPDGEFRPITAKDEETHFPVWCPLLKKEVFGDPQN